MSAIVELHVKPVRAFVRGFWKGLASPLMVYSHFELPSWAANYEFKKLPRTTGEFGDIRSDWKRVGQQLQEACEQEAPHA